MSELLLDSMAEFADLILSVLDLAGARAIVEIRMSAGGMTEPLADFVTRNRGYLVTVNPSPAPEFLAWAAAQPNVRHVARPSLDAIAQASGIDAWIIAGDPNYYTVTHELAAADALAQREGRPLLAVLHNVGWPGARRDRYHAPGSIPLPFRQPHSHHAGVTLDNAGCLIDRGLRRPEQFAWALRSGGPRNGVLTAIEDFCRGAELGARRLLYAHVPAVFGLGLLFDADAPWADLVAETVMPYHENPLLAKLEINRLRSHLAVLDWQDGYLARTVPA